MYDFLLLAEKPSAAARFSKFLGANQGGIRRWDKKNCHPDGVFLGKSFHIEPSHGHLMTYEDPEKQVKTPAEQKRYKSWDPKTMPWNPNDFAWIKTYIIGKNPFTHRNSSDKKDVMRIGKAAMKCRNIVNFSDNDPSGEGDLLAEEIDNQIIDVFHWTGHIYRGRFKSDTVKPLVINSLSTIVKHPSSWLVGTSTPESFKKNPILPIQPGNPKQWGVYEKGISRARWDYMSMQLTRICTTVARHKGYNTVVNQGRLKSVILYKIYQQLMKIKNYHKIPYFEVQFKDENGHVYSRKASAKSHPSFRHVNDLAGAKQAMAQYHASAPAGIKTETKTSAPGPLLNLSALASRLASRGFSTSKVLKAYQNLYEDGYVSYPRTADKKITEGDFKALLPKVNQIAKVVGVNPSLLTHRTLRSKYRVKIEDHGANRPGLTVPKSMSYLRSKFGTLGADIYSMIAKNYLAILCEDYVYKKTSAHLADYPAFKTSYNQPVKMNYKLVFDNSSKKSKGDVRPLGHQANPMIHQGQNPRPTKPNQNWITNFLIKNNVGTGATQASTIAELTKRGKRQRIKSSRGKFTLTQSGLICALMARGTYIASVNVTKQLFNIMDGVAKHKFTVDQCTDTATQLVEHDKPVMERNSDDLMSIVGKPKGNNKSNKVTPVTCTFQGQQIKFWPDFMKKACTQSELQDLEAGKTVTFTRKGKYGTWHPMGKLVLKTKFNGKPGIEYVGSKKKQSSGKMETATVDGKQIKFWPTIMGKKNKLTPQHIQDLKAGKKITCILTSSNGQTKYKVSGKLSLNAYKGNPGVKAKFLGFVDN